MSLPGDDLASGAPLPRWVPPKVPGCAYCSDQREGYCGYRDCPVWHSKASDRYLASFPNLETPEGWTLGYWPHLVRTGGALSRFNGWFPSRRKSQSWQVQVGSYRANIAMGAQPALTRPLPADHPLIWRLNP